MIIRKGEAARNSYPDGRDSTHLSDAGGLKQFGVHLETLPPGGATSDRHWHTAEDEFFYVLEGEATVIDDHGAHLLGPGGAAAWRQGDPNAHHVVNRTAAPVRYVIVGTRVDGDVCHFPDTGQRIENGPTEWCKIAADGAVVKTGTLPPRLQNLAPRWGTLADPSAQVRCVMPAGSVAAETGPSSYPAPYTLPDGRMRWWPFSDAAGLTQFGAFTEELMPGAQSSQRHWHEGEDEFLYVLDGAVTVVENDGEHILTPGDVACWPAGNPNAHCLINRSGRPVSYFIVGTRAKDDACHYPDIDLHYSRNDGLRTMSHKDGIPYSGWPKETNR